MSFLTFFKLFALSFILLEIRILKFTFSVFIAGKPLNLDSKLNILHYKLPPTCCYGFKLKKTTMFLFSIPCYKLCAWRITSPRRASRNICCLELVNADDNITQITSRRERKTKHKFVIS